MVQLNRSRADYYDRFQRLIDAYNGDSKNVELYLHELLALTRDLNQEDQRPFNAAIYTVTYEFILR
jgi:type I restriction enzyme, R subunit